MKYSINLNQLVLAYTKLDIVEGAIIDYLYFICTTPNGKVEEKRIDGFTWINYKHLMLEMPLLRIKSKGAITPRIKNIEKAGYIVTKIIGQRMYIRVLPKIDELFTNTNGQLKTVHENEQSAIHQNEQDNNTKKNNLKNVNVCFKLTDNEQGKLWYLLERIKDQKNIKAWIGVVGQIGFQKVENILLDVSESKDAKNMGACAMGLAKKAGYRKN